MVRRRLGALAFAAAACSLTAACAAVLGFERLSEGDPDSAAPDASTDSPAPDAEPPRCDDVGVPARPADAGAGDASHRVVAALSVLDFGLDTTRAPPGLNLDKACSRSLGESTCAVTVDETTFARYGTDKSDGGLDNAGVSLFEDIARVSSAIRPSEINARLRDGAYGGILRVSEWNGLPDDDNVVVELFPALGVVAPDGGSKPSFTGGDVWTRDARFERVAGLNASRIVAVSAYVAGGRLAAFFDELVIPVLIPDDPKPFDITLRETWVTARVVSDGAGQRLAEGTFAGRWTTGGLLGQVRTIFIKDTLGFRNVYVCEPLGKIVYDAVKENVCKARDIRSRSNDDGQGAPCDAFSIGVGFETYGLSDEGPFDAGPQVPPRCADAAVPEGDDCP